nr:hypothetical protein GCM10020092_037350 [Actinoplanes digitatis]
MTFLLRAQGVVVSRHIGGARLAGLFSVLLLLTAAPGAALAAPPAPDVHGQTVRAGHLRVQVLTPTLLRLEYAQDDAFENRPTFNAVDRAPGRTWFAASTRGGELRVRTSAVTLRYRLGSGPVTPANTTLELRVGGRATSVHPEFGSPARDDTLGGWYRGLDYYAGQASPAEQIKLHPGMLNRGGWHLLDDTATAVRDGDWVAARPAHAGAYQDGYLFGYGHDYRRGLADLRTLTGPSLLPPKWAFGTWFSKYQAYSAADYEDSLLPAFREHEVPLDSLVIDTDWKAPNQWGWLELEQRPVPGSGEVPRRPERPGHRRDAQRARRDLRRRSALRAGAGHREGQAHPGGEQLRAEPVPLRLDRSGPGRGVRRAAPAVRGTGRAAMVAGLLLRRQRRRHAGRDRGQLGQRAVPPRR